MSTEVVQVGNASLAPSVEPGRLPPVPWRDPHTVSPTKLAEYIRTLEKACEDNPQSVDLRTCLGMAHAVNYDVYKSMDALETAVKLNDRHFFAQFKYAELHYRIRALIRAEEETLKAMDLAESAWEQSLAHKQLLEIRRLMRDGTQKPEWTKSLKVPAMVLMLMTIILSLTVIWK
jgi:hypothetical protein